MNSVPAAQRGAANGMMSTFQNSGMVLSIGIFFSLMIVGLASHAAEHDVRRPDRQRRARRGRAPDRQPAAGRRPVRVVPRLQPARHAAHAGPRHRADRAQHATLTGKEFFPHLIAQPFHHGLEIVFTLAIVMSLVSAGVSLLRGKHYVHDDGAVATAESPREAEGDLLLESVDSAQA